MRLRRTKGWGNYGEKSKIEIPPLAGICWAVGGIIFVILPEILNQNIIVLMVLLLIASLLIAVGIFFTAVASVKKHKDEKASMTVNAFGQVVPKVSPLHQVFPDVSMNAFVAKEQEVCSKPKCRDCGTELRFNDYTHLYDCYYCHVSLGEHEI